MNIFMAVSTGADKPVQIQTTIFWKIIHCYIAFLLNPLSYNNFVSVGGCSTDGHPVQSSVKPANDDGATHKQCSSQLSPSSSSTDSAAVSHLAAKQSANTHNAQSQHSGRGRGCGRGHGRGRGRLFHNKPPQSAVAWVTTSDHIPGPQEHDSHKFSTLHKRFSHIRESKAAVKSPDWEFPGSECWDDGPPVQLDIKRTRLDTGTRGSTGSSSANDRQQQYSPLSSNLNQV